MATIPRENVIFEYGHTIERDQMEPRTIYLDGVVRGPVIDGAKQSYSFDHHGDCVRLVTLSTCQQVLTALDLGLNPRGFKVHLNDLDADSSLALWLLRHPERAAMPRVREQIQRVGFVDAHGPVAEPTRLHKSLEHGSGQPQTLATLWDDQQLIDTWFAHGDEALPERTPGPRAYAFGVTNTGAFVEIEGATGFADIYEAGATVAVFCPEAPHNTTGYTIAKRSEFVAFDMRRFFERINEFEPGWGGGSTIGGAPRHPDGARSGLSRDVVRDVFREVLQQQTTAPTGSSRG